ncbi:MAG: Crp/Fnr family transcriptional regulator [Bacteroidales bacterium]|nr:Crp/Fnr family transcriptional regulator [Bacteroidales bacterium]
MESEIKKELIERTKELNCLYETNELLSNLTDPFDEIMKHICKSIEKSMQYPDISQCEIIVNQSCYTHQLIKKTELKLSSKYVLDQIFVQINVYYSKPIRKEHRTIFLPEEQQLLNTLAQKIAHYYAYRNLKESYEKSAQNYYVSHPEDNVLHWLKSLSLTDNEIATLLKNVIYFKKNETICKQSTLSNYLMLLTEGYIKLSLEHYIDHQFIFKILKPNEFIGLSCLYDVQHYPFTAISLVPSKVYLIEKDTFKNIVYHNNAFAEKILTMYTKNFSFLLYRLNSIANKQALGRLCDTLLYLSEKVFESPIIESFISRKDLADLCGLSTENTVRLLSDLKNNQIVALNRNEIHILNKQKIMLLSQHG